MLTENYEIITEFRGINYGEITKIKMAIFKAIVRYPRPDGFYTVFIRVAHNTKTRYIKTDKIVNSKGFDKNNAVTDPFADVILPKPTDELPES